MHAGSPPIMLALLALTAIAPVNAQWKIPIRGVAEFTREIPKNSLLPADTRNKKEKGTDDQARSIYRAIFRGHEVLPFLFHGELDKAQQTASIPPIHIRELAWFLGTDLREGRSRSSQTIIPLAWKFGSLQIKAKFDKAAPDGQQEITAKITSATPKFADKRFLRSHVLPDYIYDISAELKIERVIDLDKGTVTRFDATMSGTITGKVGALENRKFKLLRQESWKLKGLRHNRDTEFRTGVAKAIESGTQELLKTIKNPTATPYQNRVITTGAITKDSGRLALALLAMIKGGVDPKDKQFLAAMDSLRKRKVLDSYSLGLAIMCMEAFYSPMDEARDLRSGRITRPRKRKLPPEDFKLVSRWAQALRNNRDTSTDPGYLERFNYTRGRRFDNSINQYALLGLYSAHLCGVEIPGGFWEMALNHWLLVQEPQKGSPKSVISLIDHSDYERLRLNPDATRPPPVPTTHGGWAYTVTKNTRSGADYPPTGAMTCAGLTGITICQAGIRDNDILRTLKMRDADDALMRGFAWLADHFTVRWNPGTRSNHFLSHWYYYLYGVERSCELSSIRLFNDRDWYFEGAMALMHLRKKAGYWGTAGSVRSENTSFAVLFLRKAVLPVYTRRTQK